eukprot:GHVN01072595.1.p2 GENE.GHVN01072595.1~~GHVN01072595.1.p2  ORF type:complete len:465 (-),score=36.87 GHVN01072595.1:3752-5146(-)
MYCFLFCLVINSRAKALDPLSFMTLGDWGKVGEPLFRIAQAIELAGSGITTSHIIALGDNFYEAGVTDATTDPQWNTSFEEVFTQAVTQVPWLAIMGNHDWWGRASAQIERFRKGLSPRWIMPNYNFFTLSSIPEEKFDDEANKTVVERFVVATVFLDTWVTCLPFLSGIGPSEREAQLSWLEATLKAVQVTADWVFVVGHHPVFSSGSHGDTGALKKYVLPMMRRLNVDVYFSGHDHHMEMLEDDTAEYDQSERNRTDPLFFVLSGAAAKSRSLGKKRNYRSKFATSDYGFTRQMVTSQYLRIDYIDETVLTRHSQTVTRGGFWPRNRRGLEVREPTQRALQKGNHPCDPFESVYTVVGIQDVPTYDEIMDLIDTSGESDMHPYVKGVPNSCMLTFNHSDLETDFIHEGSAKLFGRPIHAYLPFTILLISSIGCVAACLCILWGYRKSLIGISNVRRIVPSEV